MRGTILVVDDRARRRNALATRLEGRGYAVAEASDGVEGWRHFRVSEPDLVITDWVLPHCDGEALLRRIRTRSDVPVFVFSSQATIQSAVKSFKAGADEYLADSDVELDDVVDLVDASLARGPAATGGSQLERFLPGRSKLIQRVRSRLEALAPLRSPVLVSGEPGMDLATVVRGLHECGSSAGGPLVVIDCATWRSARGLPRAAAVHLCGVEQLAASAQAFWLDQLRGLERGGFRESPRVLATAGPDLLFDRQPTVGEELRRFLSRFPIQIPSLCERPEDVPDIADAMVSMLATQLGRAARLSESARAFLRARRWPGQIEQLAQLMERSVAFSTGATIRRELLVELSADLEESVEAIRMRHETLERDALVAALHATGGNVSRTALRIGRSRGAVYRLIDKYGIALTSSR